MEHTLQWSLIILSLVGLVSSLPGRIHVGGLFEGDDEENELAFRVAVDWLNTDDTVLKNSRMVGMVEKLYTEDSLKTTQLSCGLLQKGIAAIFGPVAQLSSMHVQSICDDLEVPHIEYRWEYRLERDQLAINLYPHPAVLSRAFVQLLTTWGWNDFYIVYESDEAVLRLTNFLKEGEIRNWNIRLFQTNMTSYRKTFWAIKGTEKKSKLKSDHDYRIILDVEGKNLYDALKAAQQVGMMTEHQKYLITSLDLHTIDLKDFQFGKTNITGLRLVHEENEIFQAFLKEINHRLVRRRDQPPLKTLKTEAALIYDSVRLLAYALEQMDLAKNISTFPPISCTAMNKGIDGTTLFNFMKNAQMTSPSLSGPIRFDREGFRKTLSFYVMYLTNNGLKNIGYIMPGAGINITSFPTAASEFDTIPLENSHFKVTTFLTAPYVMLKESAEKKEGNEAYEGFGIDLLDALSRDLKFSYEIHPVADKSYGRENPVTKEWDGMIGEIMKDKAQLAIADLTINTDRLQGVDFTLPFMQTGISILFKKPTEKTTSLFSFLSPFSGEVWLLVMAAYTFISISYFLVGRLSPYEWSNPHPCRQNDQVEENVFSILNSMWFAIGSLMQQGSDIAPTAMSTRAITSIWYFFCLILISSYTANLAAFLTVEQLVSPINNVDDLAKQEKIKYGCLASGSTRLFFQKSSLPVYQKMYRFMQKHKDEVYMKKNQEGIDKVEGGNYAYLMEATSIEYNTERFCNLTQVGGLLDSKGYGIAVNKTKPEVRAWLSRGILKLQESGQLHLFKEKWWKEKKGGGQCAPSKSSGSVNELGLNNVGGVFVVMLLGISLSAAMGIIEFFWFQRKLQKDSEKSIFKLLMRELRYAITCGSSSKAAPKLKSKKTEDAEKPLPPGYSSLY